MPSSRLLSVCVQIFCTAPLNLGEPFDPAFREGCDTPIVLAIIRLVTSQSDALTEPSLSIENKTAGTASLGERPGKFESPLLWLLVLIVLGLAMPFVPVPNPWAAVIGAVVITCVYTLCVVQLIVQFARLRLSPLVIAGLFVVCAVIWGATNFVVLEAVLPRRGSPVSLQQILLFTSVKTAVDISLLCTAALGGALLSRLISEPNMLAPVSALIALIDIWGVLFGGIVAQLMEKAPTVAQHAMSSVPTVGAATASVWKIPLPDIGAGDYLFLGLLFSALCNNNMNWRGAVKWVTPLVSLALLSIPLSAIFLHQDIALPGLLFIGLGVALPNWNSFTFTKDEKFAMLWAGVFVAFLTAGLYFAAPYIINSAVKLEGTAQKAKSAPAPTTPANAAPR